MPPSEMKERSEKGKEGEAGVVGREVRKDGS